MLTPFSHFPRIIQVEDDLDDLMSNVMDVAFPFSYSPFEMIDPYRYRRHKRVDDRKYVISISIGPYYKLEDIHTSFDDRKLKVEGCAVQPLSNGENHHKFSREYEIPQDIDLKTMQKRLLADGTLHITFEKIYVEPKKDIEDLSKDNEFKVKINVHGFKPEEISIKIVGRDLVLEATKKCEGQTEACKAESCVSRYLSRSIRLGQEVDIDKIRVTATSDGCLEVSAPRDVSKLKPAERTLQIEK